MFHVTQSLKAGNQGVRLVENQDFSQLYKIMGSAPLGKNRIREQLFLILENITLTHFL